MLTFGRRKTHTHRAERWFEWNRFDPLRCRLSIRVGKQRQQPKIVESLCWPSLLFISILSWTNKEEKDGAIKTTRYIFFLNPLPALLNCPLCAHGIRFKRKKKMSFPLLGGEKCAMAFRWYAAMARIRKDVYPVKRKEESICWCRTITPIASNRTRARVLNRIQDGHLFNPLCSGFVGSSRASLVSVDSNAWSTDSSSLKVI